MRVGSLPKWARAAIAVVALLIVSSYAMGAVARYRAGGTEAAKGAGQTAASPAKPAAGEKAAEKGGSTSGSSESKKPASADPKGPVVVVKVDGLNFRREPDKDADVIRGLDEGEKLKLIKEKDGWYQAEDSDGERGWLYASEQYSRLEE